MYYNRVDSLIHQLPPPISLDSQTIDTTLHELRHRVEESSRNDAIEQPQLKKLIEEVAGAFLSEYLQMQEAVDWYLVRKYVDLLEIEGIHPHHHTQRIELLEILYRRYKQKLRRNFLPKFEFASNSAPLFVYRKFLILNMILQNNL